MTQKEHYIFVAVLLTVYAGIGLIAEFAFNYTFGLAGFMVGASLFFWISAFLAHRRERDPERPSQVGDEMAYARMRFVGGLSHNEAENQLQYRPTSEIKIKVSKNKEEENREGLPNNNRLQEID